MNTPPNTLVGPGVTDQVRYQIWDKVIDQIWDDVKEHVWFPLIIQVESLVGSHILDQVVEKGTPQKSSKYE